MQQKKYPLIIEGDPIATLKECGGYYECPRDAQGKRCGPLVGYAGKYEAPDGAMKAYVGDVYINCAKAEEYPYILDHFAEQYLLRRGPLLSCDACVMLGVPMGGIMFAHSLARLAGHRFAYVEKSITTPAMEGRREESVLVFGRHEIYKGEHVVIVEDVCNNFSTTEKILSLVGKAGGIVVAIACIFNRSPGSTYRYGDQMIPVESVVHRWFPQYKQEGPAVAEDVASGNVVWKPKDEWQRLTNAMREHSS